MPQTVIVVKAAYDSEAGVWFVEASDVAGLNVEAETIEALLCKLPGAVRDLIEDDGVAPVDIPIELIAHASTRTGEAA